MEKSVQRYVVKVGTSVLTDERGRLIRSRLNHLVDQISRACDQHAFPVLVSSGAIACGMAKLGLSRRPRSLAQLQACAAIGQVELMQFYNRAFTKRGLQSAQVLLTQDDLSDKQRFANAKQTLLALMHRRVVPIVNENDTVAVDEIAFGDNDRLAALVSGAVDAQLLVLLSDVEGFFQQGQMIERIDSLTDEHFAAVHSNQRATTKGGMRSKLEAARIVGHNGIPMVIASGKRKEALTDVLSGKSVGTLFVPPADRLSSKKWWIAFSLRLPKGRVIIDPGAQEAVLQRGKSLLASGILSVEGRFEEKSCVAVLNQNRDELARGVVNYASTDLRKILGLQSTEISQMLKVSRPREVVHRDHMVFAREWAGK